MKMSGRITSCCVALLLTFTAVSAVKRVLRSIDDLNVDSRELLRWFANAVNIDTDGVICLTFDPNSGDYGSHHYGNYERLLEPPLSGYNYYTLGNINKQTSLQVPSQGRNKARVIVSVLEQDMEWEPQIIDRVDITQHFETFDNRTSAYDPEQTYEITISLLEELRESRIDMHDNSMTHFEIANTSQLLDGRSNRTATRRNEEHYFRTNENCVPKWLLALFGILILLVILIIFAKNIKK